MLVLGGFLPTWCGIMVYTLQKNKVRAREGCALPGLITLPVATYAAASWEGCSSPGLMSMHVRSKSKADN
jgi:hypothetical protein